VQSHATHLQALTALIATSHSGDGGSEEKDTRNFATSSQYRAQAVQLFDYFTRISTFGLGQYGFRSDIIHSTKLRELLSYVHISMQLIFPTLSGPKALRAALSLTFSRPWYQSVDILGGHIGVTNIVPHDAPIVVAAKSGDVAMVENLIRRGQASIADSTSDARPLLWVCFTHNDA
jgi:hypothetical protein